MKIFTLTLLFISSLVQTHAQESSNAAVQWYSGRTFDVDMGTWKEEETSLVVVGSERMEWKNADGSVRQVFTLRDVHGRWTNLAQPGSIIYEISHAQGLGTVYIEKTGTETLARIMLTGSGDLQSFELTITGYQVQ